jgi:hypothetical protein
MPLLLRSSILSSWLLRSSAIIGLLPRLFEFNDAATGHTPSIRWVGRAKRSSAG